MACQSSVTLKFMPSPGREIRDECNLGMSTSSLHKLPPGSTLGSVPVDIRFYAAENPGAKDRAGVVMRGPVSGTARAANPVI